MWADYTYATDILVTFSKIGEPIYLLYTALDYFNTPSSFFDYAEEFMIDNKVSKHEGVYGADGDWFDLIVGATN